MVIEFVEPAPGSKLLVRFDDEQTKVKWASAILALVQFLQLTN
jgi:hypothetical protein